MSPTDEPLAVHDGVIAPKPANTMAKGMRSIGGAQAGQLALQIVSVAALARLLTPDEFGLFAMVTLVIGVAELFRDMGLSNAAVQAPEMSMGLRSNLFWANTGVGALLTVLVAASAPLIAAIYDRQELIPITIALAPTFLLSGLSTQYRVHLIRELRFGTLAAISMITPIAALVVAVTAALSGLGVWAIVIQSLASAVLTFTLLLFTCRWLPGRPSRATGIRGMLRLGGVFLASSLLTYVRMSVDSFIIGHQFGAEALGLYNRSVQVIRTPIRQLQQPFSSVVIPMAARLRDSDAAFMASLREFQPLMGYGVCVIAGLVAAAPQDVVLLVLGDQWLRAAPVLAVVAVSSAVAAASSPVAWLYTARGMGTALLCYTVFTTVLTIGLILAGATFGPVGAASGYLASAVLTFPTTFLRAERTSGLPMIRFGIQCARPVLLLALIWGSASALRLAWEPPAPWGIFVSMAIVGLICGAAAMLSAYREDYCLVFQSVKSMR